MPNHPRHHHTRKEVPQFFRDAIEYLSRDDIIVTEGILRISASESRLTMLRQKINYGERT
jgi:hypothetical protein